MELRVLEYFLAVAEEQNISRAAEKLHLTQPTLSRQLRDLEEELGRPLFLRGKRRITLTDDGILFRKKADEIVRLVHRAESDMKNPCHTISGDVYIGAGESYAMHNIIRTADQVHRQYPGVHFHFTSGDTADLIDRLDKGLFDFCILYGEINQSGYEYLELPYIETWGLLMRRDSALADRSAICTRELWDKPLIVSRQALSSQRIIKWIGKSPAELNIAATYNLVYNAQIMAELGMGYVLTLEHLVNTNGGDLCFRPLCPTETLPLTLVWKKNSTHSKAACTFLKALSDHIESSGSLEFMSEITQ